MNDLSLLVQTFKQGHQNQVLEIVLKVHIV